MQVEVSFRDLPHEEKHRLLQFTSRRAQFATRRLRWLRPRAEIRLSRAQLAPRGAEKRCEVTLQAQGAGAVCATAMARDWHVAVDEALSHAVRRLMRLLRRGAANDRGRSL